MAVEIKDIPGDGSKRMGNPRAKTFYNYLRLDFLLRSLGSDCLRKYFEKRYQTLTKVEWKNGAKSNKDFVWKQTGKKLWQKLQQDMISTDDLGKMDLACLVQLLTKIKWEKGMTDEQLEVFNIEHERLKDMAAVRNKLAHLTDSKSLSESDFAELWRTAERRILEMGGEALKAEIEKILMTEELEGLQFSTGAVSDENMTKSKALRDEGKVALQTDLNVAIEKYTEALRLEGLTPIELGTLYSNRSYAYCQRAVKAQVKDAASEESLNLAHEDVKKAIELRPTWWEGYYRAAEVYVELGSMKAALISCNQAVELSSENDRKLVDELQAKCLELAKSEEKYGTKTGPRSKPTEEVVTEDVREWAHRRKIKLPDTNDLSKLISTIVDTNKPEDIAAGAVFHGHCYMFGFQFKKSKDMGARNYIKAAGLKNVDGLYYCGLAHLLGEGIPRSETQAVEFFKNAATSNVDTCSGTIRLAMCELGKCYERGTGTSKGEKEAASWYRKASDLGNGEASNLLANLYNEGRGVTQSKEEAIQCWIKAANQEYVAAMYTLAWEFLGLNKLDKAEEWFSRSKDAGHLQSFLKSQEFYDKVQTLQSEPAPKE